MNISQENLFGDLITACLKYLQKKKMSAMQRKRLELQRKSKHQHTQWSESVNLQPLFKKSKELV